MAPRPPPPRPCPLPITVLMDSLGRIAKKEKEDSVNRLLCSCVGARQRAKGAASQRHSFRKGEVKGRPPNRPPAWMESEPEAPDLPPFGGSGQQFD